MKKILKLFYLIIIGCYFSQAHAISYQQVSCPSGSGTCYQLNGVSADCSEWEDKVYSCQFPSDYIYNAQCIVRSCTACRESMVPAEPTLFQPSGVVFDGSVYASLSCEEYTCNASNCVSDTSYKSGNTGYEYKTNRSCSNNKCVESNVYRCASGYYGSSTNGTTGCTQCPPDPKNDKNLGQSTPGTTSIIECYLKTESASKDDTGEFIYKNDCYYKQ